MGNLGLIASISTTGKRCRDTSIKRRSVCAELQHLNDVNSVFPGIWFPVSFKPVRLNSRNRVCRIKFLSWNDETRVT